MVKSKGISSRLNKSSGGNQSLSNGSVAGQQMTLKEFLYQSVSKHSYVEPNSTGTAADMIPDWFADRNRVGGEQIYMGSIARETEKAVLISGSTVNGRKIELWVPKSILQTPEQQRESRINEAVNKNLNSLYTSYLKRTASDNGVKVGNLSSWDKIKAKLSKNGVSFMQKEEFANTTNNWHERFKTP